MNIYLNGFIFEVVGARRSWPSQEHINGLNTRRFPLIDILDAYVVSTREVRKVENEVQINEVCDERPTVTGFIS